ncbi:MAG TPA: hypothetical protein VK856_02405 [Anaerolineaceae bacterium]|nr:hypothetical protein [Anaerolineaceae bacterium]
MKKRSANFWLIGSLIIFLLVSGFSSNELSRKYLLPSDHSSQNTKIVASEDDPENEEICGLQEPDCEETFDGEAKRIEIDLERAEQAKVIIMLFWMQDCAHCTEVLNYLLPEIYLTHADQVYFYPIELKEITEIDLFYQMAERLGVQKNNIGVPLMIIGDQVLAGNQIDNSLKKLIADSLEREPYTFIAIPEFEEKLPEFLRSKQVDHTINVSNQSNDNQPFKTPFPLALIIGMPLIVIAGLTIYIFTKKNNLRS